MRGPPSKTPRVRFAAFAHLVKPDTLPHTTTLWDGYELLLSVSKHLHRLLTQHTHAAAAAAAACPKSRSGRRSRGRQRLRQLC
jgi:hypothetical protein